jgi:hypothetical protein
MYSIVRLRYKFVSLLLSLRPLFVSPLSPFVLCLTCSVIEFVSGMLLKIACASCHIVFLAGEQKCYQITFVQFTVLLLVHNLAHSPLKILAKTQA